MTRTRAKRWRPHLTTVLIVAIAVVGAVTISAVAQQAYEDNEQQLLDGRREQARGLLNSLGGEWIANLETIAAVVSESDGDLDRAAEAINAEDDLGSWTWGVFRRGGGELEVEPIRPADERNGFVLDLRDAEMRAPVEDGLGGEPTFVGLIGNGLDRRFSFVVDTPRSAEFAGVLVEVPLMGVTGSDDDEDDGSSGFDDVGVQLYDGTTADPDQQIIGFGPTDGPFRSSAVFELANTELFVVLTSDGGLGGELGARLPLILFVALLAAAALVALVNEIAERRADDALALVDDLEDKNAALDLAIVEREHAAERREQAERELWRAQRLEAVGQLAGGVAHDFNNLLAAITTYAELAADGVDDPSVREDLEQIRSSARRGAGLTRQLLLFARSSTDESPVAEVSQVINEIDGLVRSAAGTPTRLSFDLADDLPAVGVGPIALEQIVINLVVNARDAIDEGGSIDVVARRGADGLVELSVSDDGAGMPPDVADRAFEPFFSTKTNQGGSGLGLATVYGIVTRAGGSVGLDSEVGRGTTVTLALPVAEGTRVDEDGPAAVDGARGATSQGCRVLLVDDESAVRKATARLLERRGYEVETAGSGQEAIERLDDDHFDVVVTDLLMPGQISGRGVLAHLEEHQPNVAVLVITGYSGSDPADEVSVPMLAKPFSDAELAEAIEDCRRHKVAT